MKFPYRFSLVIGLTFCGCSDGPRGTTAQIAKPAPTPSTNSAPKQLSAAIRPKTRKFTGPHDVIVEGRFAVDVMQMVGPPRANELAQRLQQVVRANPDWWLEHVKKSKPGEPLPYDARLGLSEAEYDEFLVLSSKMTTQKKDEAMLIVAKKNDDAYVFDGGQALPDFTGIEIDLKNDWVRTPFGVLTERSEIDASDASALGAWVGTEWKLVKLDANGVTGTIAKLAVGQLKRSGRCVIYYDVKKISPDGKTRIAHVLNYDVPVRE